MRYIYFIPLAAMCGFALLLHKRRASLPSKIISWLYLGCFVVAVTVPHDELPTFNFDHSVSSLVQFSVLTAIALVPTLYIRKPDWRFIVQHRLLQPTMWLLSIMIWFSVIYLVPFAQEALLVGAARVRYMLNVERVGILPSSPLTTAAVAVAFYYPIYAMLFFVSMVKHSSRFMRISMFIGAFLSILSSLCFTARDGALWFIMAMAIGYWVFGDAVRDRLMGWVRSLILVFSGIGLVALSVFTYDRFSGSMNILSSQYGYYGAQPYVFAETVAEQREFYGWSMRFPLIAELTGEYYEILRTKAYEWSFGTMIRDFYSVNGWTSAYALTIAFSLLFSLALSRDPNRAAVPYSLALILYVQYIVQGLFYFRLGSSPGNIYMLSVAVLYVVFMFGAGVSAERRSSMKRKVGRTVPKHTRPSIVVAHFHDAR